MFYRDTGQLLKKMPEPTDYTAEFRFSKRL
jgi:hypothetical protein